MSRRRFEKTLDGRDSKRLEKFALHGVRDCLQTVVSVEFLIDVVQMVAEGLQGYFESARNLRRVLTCRKKAQDLYLLLGRRSDRHGFQRHFLYAGQLTRDINHLVEKDFVLFSFGDVVCEMHDETPMIPRVFIN